MSAESVAGLVGLLEGLFDAQVGVDEVVAAWLGAAPGLPPEIRELALALATRARELRVTVNPIEVLLCSKGPGHRPTSAPRDVVPDMVRCTTALGDVVFAFPWPDGRWHVVKAPQQVELLDQLYAAEGRPIDAAKVVAFRGVQHRAYAIVYGVNSQIPGYSKETRWVEQSGTAYYLRTHGRRFASARVPSVDVLADALTSRFRPAARPT